MNSDNRPPLQTLDHRLDGPRTAAHDWQPAVRLLERGLARLASASHGADPELDARLADLRLAIDNRAADNELARRVDEIGDLVARLEQQRRNLEATPGLARVLDVLALNAPAPVSAAAAVLAAQLPPAPEPEHWRKGLNLLRSALRQPQGLWARLRSHRQAPATPPIGAALRASVERLLDLQAVPAVLAERRAALQAQAREIRELDELPELIEAAIALTQAAKRDLREQLEAFLRLLLERLDQLQDLLRQSADEHRLAAGERKSLSASINARLDGIRTDLEGEPGTERLRVLVTERLERVAQDLAEYCRQREASELAAVARIGKLAARLQETEREAAQLRAALLEQQAQARRDTLTRIPNREAYQQRLDLEYGRWLRYGSPLSLVIADVDRFKQINDRFGHSTGDKVLRTIAQHLHANLRQTDFLARYGGEEFVLLMPQTELAQARQVADKLRLAMASCVFHSGAESILVTVSFGVTQFRPGDLPDAAFDRADAALYRAKHGGRNQVVLAE